MATTPTSAIALSLYIVLLANRGNPDHGQDTESPLPGTGADQEKVVGTLASASALCQKYIQAFQLGAGNWAGGRVTRLDGTPVGHVAYNGRVFSTDRRTVLQETVDPAQHWPHGHEAAVDAGPTGPCPCPPSRATDK
mgnify:CR=1 FL=1